jgi:hypothetical protein
MSHSGFFNLYNLNLLDLVFSFIQIESAPLTRLIDLSEIIILLLSFKMINKKFDILNYKLLRCNQQNCKSKLNSCISQCDSLKSSNYSRKDIEFIQNDYKIPI